MTTPLNPFVALRRQLHQIPEPGFEEVKTQRLLLDYLATLPGERMEIQTWKTGILVHIPGNNPSRRIGYRADMDALPVEEETTLPFRSTHPGWMHACGHDFHMAIALGVLTHFVHHPIDDDLLFVFQPAEEGPGGAKPLLESEIFNARRPDMMLALHIAPEYPVGTIAVKPGILFANTSELYIDLVGRGGHAAMPHLANDMVIAASQLAIQLQSIVSRNVDPQEAAILTIGKLNAGTRQNVIAGKARLEGTIRTLSPETMRKVKDRIGAMVRGIGEAFDCQTAIDWGAGYCQVYNDDGPDPGIHGLDPHHRGSAGRMPGGDDRRRLRLLPAGDPRLHVLAGSGHPLRASSSPDRTEGRVDRSGHPPGHPLHRMEVAAGRGDTRCRVPTSWRELPFTGNWV